jgi:hypothetical protein
MLLLPEADMERVIPWKELEEEVSPVAPSMKPGQLGGRPAYPLSVMLRIYLCQKKKPVGGELTESDKARNRKLSSRRAIGEHPFPRKLHSGGGSNIAISDPKRRE